MGKTIHRLLLLLMLSTVPAFSVASPLADIFVRPDLPSGRVVVHAEIELLYPGDTEYTLELAILDGSGSLVGSRQTKITVKSGRASVLADLPVRGRPWTPDQPHVYQALLRLLDFRGLEADQRRVTFGFRRLERRGNRLFLNESPLFLRAFAGDFLAGGDHGCMSSDRAYIRKRILMVKSYGFNTERHHTHFPTETYLELADELGLMQQLEIHADFRQGPGSVQFESTRQLWEQMLRLGRRHTSVIINSMGNEVYSNDPKLVAAVSQLYDLAKQFNPDALVLKSSGSLPGNDETGKYDLIERPIGEYEHSGSLVGEALQAYLRGERVGRAREFPVIAHEYPLVSAFPRVENSSLYPSVPPWLEAAAENARRHGYLDEMPRFARNAEAIQWRVIKQMIEEARKFPELAGYSMLRLHDTGASVGGILDDFSNPKSVPAREFLKVNGPTVLLAEWNAQTFHSGDRFETRLAISRHQQEVLQGALSWRIVGPDGEWAKGKSSVRAEGFGTFAAEIVSLNLPNVTRPAHFTLEATLVTNSEPVTNDWDFWIFPVVENRWESFKVYDPNSRLGTITRLYPKARLLLSPAQLNSKRDVLVTDSWPEWVEHFLEQGGRLLLISDKSWKEPEEMGNHGSHQALFTSRAPVSLPELDEPLTHWLTIPSNYATRWGNSGTVVEAHPALGDFPNQGFCDFQFFCLIRRAKSFWLDRFPRRPEPIIRAIDNFWHGNNKAYLLEFRVDQGRVLASTLNFTQHLGRAPEADYLFLQLLRYVQKASFQPKMQFSASELKSSMVHFAIELPELIKRIGDANAPPKSRYTPVVK